MTQVFCYGPIAMDNIIQVPNLPEPDLPAVATGDQYHTGGAMANTSIWLANWGVETRLTGTTLGYDETAEFIIEYFKQFPALDLTYLQQQAEVQSPICRVMVTPDGQRTFLNYWFHLSPLAPFDPDMLNGAQFFLGDRHASDRQHEPAELAAQAGTSVLISDIVTLDHPTLPYLKYSLNSADLIRGRFSGIDVRQRVHELREVHQGTAILTDSANPVYVIDSTGNAFTVTPPEVQAVDATGAGDALRAGVVYGLLQGWTLEQAVCFGVAAGSLKVRHLGAASNPALLQDVTQLAQTLSSETVEI